MSSVQIVSHLPHELVQFVCRVFFCLESGDRFSTTQIKKKTKAKSTQIKIFDLKFYTLIKILSVRGVYIFEIEFSCSFLERDINTAVTETSYFFGNILIISLGNTSCNTSHSIITITTKTGNKTVTLEREGVATNIINRLVSGSTWLTLKQGENQFYVRASEGLSSLKVRLIHRNAYLGV